MNIEDVKQKYKNEWVIVEVLKEDDTGYPVEVKLIEHSKNRDDVYDKLKETKGRHTYQFYTGEIPTKGYAVAFYGKNRL